MVLWDFSTQMENVIKAQKQDFVLVDKENVTFKTAAFTIPGNSNTRRR